MSISDVRREFTAGLGGRGTCTKAEMSYLEGGRRQRFTFTASVAGSTHVVVKEIGGAADPNASAREAGAELAASLGE